VKITEIIWLNSFVQKIEHKHAVRLTEVDQFFANRPRIQFAESVKVPLPEQFNNLDDAVEFWDTHSLADYQEAWRDVQCEIDIKRRTYQISLDSGIYQKLRRAARERGVSAETLVNLWLQEKVS